MPTLKKLCPRCRVRTVATGRTCVVCSKGYEHTRRPAWVGRLYSSGQWQEVRRIVKARSPLCQDCGLAPSVDVHHIVPMLKAPHLALAYDNLKALCRPCHDRLGK
jgi:5-methylcytosine-specific restriction endonuclease McrA